MTNAWAEKKLSKDDVIAILNSRGYKSIAALAEAAGYQSVYLFQKDYKDHIPARGDKVKIPRKREPKPVISREIPPPPLPEAKPTSGVVQRLNAVMIGCVGLTLGVVGLALNYQFARSLGQSPIASHLLGTLGVVTDLITMFLLPGAFIMWERKNHGQAILSALIWVFFLGLSIIAGMSFAAGNIGDSLQSRGDIVQRRQALTIELSSVQAERAKIAEDREPEVIEQLIQAERGRIPIKRLTSSEDCTNVTSSGPDCAGLLQLRAAKITAAKRIYLDAQSRVISEKIASMPAIAVKDPGADHISRMTFGLIEPSEVENFRVIGFAFMPSLAGFLLAFARTMGR